MDGALVGYKPPADQLGTPFLGSRGQVPNSAENFTVAQWNDIDALDCAAEDGGIAAVVMEPVLCNSGCVLPRPGYLEQVRRLCTERGILLIFDEVITGFRLSLRRRAGVLRSCSGPGDLRKGSRRRRAAQWHSRTRRHPDADVRRRDFRRQFQRQPGFPGFGQCNLDRTSARPWRCPRSRATDGAAPHGRHTPNGSHPGRGLGIWHGVRHPLHPPDGRPSPPDYRDTLTDDTGLLRRLLYRALEQGLHIVPDGRMYVSAAHTDQDIDDTLARLEVVFSDLS